MSEPPKAPPSGAADDPTSRLPARPDLRFLRDEAKRRRKAVPAMDASAGNSVPSLCKAKISCRSPILRAALALPENSDT